VENIPTNYVRCRHNFENHLFCLFSQRSSNLCLYWRCWNVQTIAAGPWRENAMWSLTICGSSTCPASFFFVMFQSEMLTVWCCDGDWEESDWQQHFYCIACNHLTDLLDLLILWKGLRTPNLFQFVHHVMSVLWCKYGVMKCLRLLVQKEAFVPNLVKGVINASGCW
jgi:hypothetical protein